MFLNGFQEFFFVEFLVDDYSGALCQHAIECEETSTVKKGQNSEHCVIRRHTREGTFHGRHRPKHKGKVDESDASNHFPHGNSLYLCQVGDHGSL